MSEQQQQWFQANGQTLMKGNIPVDTVVDKLITQHLLDPRRNDTQDIKVEPAVHEKTRLLLDALPNEGERALPLVKEALHELCPDVLPLCIDPPHKTAELGASLHDVYTNSAYTVLTSMSWLDDEVVFPPQSCTPDLVLFKRKQMAARLKDPASSTTNEQKAMNEKYAIPTSEKRVPLQSVFDGPSTRDTGLFGADSQVPSSASSTTPHVAASDPVAQTLLHVRHASQDIHPAPSAALWGGAGLGKTACCATIAVLHAPGNIWPFFLLMLLFKLRDPAVQAATTLAQLLENLLPHVPSNQCAQYASCLEATQGEGVLIMCDGVDEFEPYAETLSLTVFFKERLC